MTETQLQSAIIELARVTGWLCYHTHDSRHSAKGFPDLCMVRCGRVIFAELKSEKGKLTPEQEQWQIRLVQTDAEYYVWRPVDWMSGRVDEVLKRGGD